MTYLLHFSKNRDSEKRGQERMQKNMLFGFKFQLILVINNLTGLWTRSIVPPIHMFNLGQVPTCI